MLANNNLKVCRTLVKRDFQFHRTKNLILVLAAMLVTALYSFVFSLGSAVKDAYLLNYQYKYGSTSHILYTGLTEHQADVLAENANVKNTVRISAIGWLSDAVIGQRVIKLAVTDRAYADTVLSVPTTGRLPEQAGEIALDEFTMDSLGVSHEIGAPVTLQWTDADGIMHTSEFALCGWWLSPTNYTESCAWIAADTAKELMPGYDEETARNVTLGVNLHQPKNLDEQAKMILSEQGMTDIVFSTNLAYNDARKEQAQRNAMPYYAPALLVVLCGYLMIYSIIHVAAERDSLFFAELKSLGMTPRQLRRFLLEQGAAVSLVGTIPGWMLGFVIHFLVTSRIVTGMEENTALYFLSWKPFVMAAGCTLLTVWLAYLIPTIRLSGMTPMQLIHLTSKRVQKRKRTSDGRMTLMQLAFRTLGRSRWHMLWSVLSLLCAVLLLSSVWIRYVSVKEERYLSTMSPWDYSIMDGSAYFSLQQYNENNQGIAEDVVKELESRPEVTSVSTIKTRELKLKSSEQLRRRIVDFYNQPYDDTQTLRESQSAYPDWCKRLDWLEETGEYVGLVIGMDGEYLKYLLEYSPFTSGSFDADAFASGDYVLTAGAYYDGISTLAEGETVELGGRTFEVMGSVKHDDTYLEGAASREAAFHIDYIVPTQVFDELFPEQSYRQLAVNIDHSRQAEFEEYLDEYKQELNHGIGITKRSEWQSAFRDARLNLVVTELIIGLLLLGIAFINFVNMLVVKTVSRRCEFAVYEGLGMTRIQLRRLLLLEGVFHALLLAAIITPITLLFDCFVMPGVVEAMQSWSMVYTFSAMPLLLSLLVIVALAVATPLGCLSFVTRGSLGERMNA